MALGPSFAPPCPALHIFSQDTLETAARLHFQCPRAMITVYKEIQASDGNSCFGHLTHLDMTFLKHSHAQKSCKEDIVKLYDLILGVWSWT